MITNTCLLLVLTYVPCIDIAVNRNALTGFSWLVWQSVMMVGCWVVVLAHPAAQDAQHQAPPQVLLLLVTAA